MNEYHIAHNGTECPAFVADRTLKGEPGEHVHKATVGSALLWMIVNKDGGIVTYDDGQDIYRRVFETMETAIDVFRGTVQATSDEFDDDYSYSPGDFEVDMDGEPDTGTGREIKRPVADGWVNVDERGRAYLPGDFKDTDEAWLAVLEEKGSVDVEVDSDGPREEGNNE